MTCEGEGHSLQFTRGKTRHRIHGCPGRHVPETIRAALRDYDKQLEGIVAPYHVNELPAKYAEIIESYNGWRDFFDAKADDINRGGVPKGIQQIEDFRRQHPRR